MKPGDNREGPFFPFAFGEKRLEVEEIAYGFGGKHVALLRHSRAGSIRISTASGLFSRKNG